MDKKKRISVAIKGRDGKVRDINTVPSIIENVKNSRLAFKVSSNLKDKPAIKKIFKCSCVDLFDKREQIINSACLNMLKDGISSVRQKKVKKKDYKKFDELIKQLKSTKRTIHLLDDDLKNDLSMALAINNLELKAVDEMLNSCLMIKEYRNSPTHYYSCLINTLRNFYIYRLDNSQSIERKVMTRSDWDFFRELISHIHFEIAHYEDVKPFDDFKSAKRGLEITFKKLKELNKNFFSNDFPDS
ncbi:hypothetical protein ATW7_05496 [Alteromonadales bacterium TW-7]|nr:hypothetical protein ATW7_05496 [Alteromonadales bacterium TW-7]